MTVWSAPPATGVVHVVSRSSAGRETVWDVVVAAHDGTVTVTLEGLRVRFVDVAGRAGAGAWRVESRPVAPGAQAPRTLSSAWIVAADEQGAPFGALLAKALGTGPALTVGPGAVDSWRRAFEQRDGTQNTCVVLTLFGAAHKNPVRDAADTAQVLRDLVQGWHQWQAALPGPVRHMTMWLITGPSGALPAAHGVTGDFTAAGAAAWGTARTIANETPQITVRRVSSQTTAKPEAVARQVADLVTASPENLEATINAVSRSRCLGNRG